MQTNRIIPPRKRRRLLPREGAMPRPVSKPPSPPPRSPERWPVAPGEAGYNRFAQQKLQGDPGITKLLTCQFDKHGGDLWYQQVLAWTLRPVTNITRLLVVWQLGAGKSIGMIRALESRFGDPRNKYVLVPQLTLVDNFWKQLVSKDNVYLQWLRRQHESECAAAVQRGDGELAKLASEVFSKRGGGGGKPVIIAMTYDQAGRVANHVRTKGMHLNAAGGFADAVFVCDECHNLIHPEVMLASVAASNEGGFVERVAETRRRLFHASPADTVVVFFTATPVVYRGDTQDMLTLVKGAAHTASTHEGFMVWYTERPIGIFPRAPLQPTVKPVPMHSSLASSYTTPKQGRAGGEQTKPCFGGIEDDFAVRAGCLRKWATREAWGLPGQQVVEMPESRATKLYAMAREIVHGAPVRTCVLIHWGLGMMHFVKILRNMLKGAGGAQQRQVFVVVTHQETARGGWEKPKNRKEQNDVRLAGEKVIAAFNSALPPSAPHILVLPADTHSEGVDLQNVRHVILADLSPGLLRPSWTLVKQRIGRAVRLCSHQMLPVEEQDVRVTLFVSTLGDGGPFRTIEEEKLQVVLAQRPDIEAELELLQGLAIDAPPYYGETLRKASAQRVHSIHRKKYQRQSRLPRSTEEAFPFAQLEFELEYPDWYTEETEEV